MDKNNSLFVGLIAGVVITLAILFTLKSSNITQTIISYDQTTVQTQGPFEKQISNSEQLPYEFSKGVLSKGPKNAPIVITEYADFHCGYCKKAFSTTQEILKKYPNDIRYAFKHFPLQDTPGSGSYLTHEASLCAHEQGKFWEYNDMVFKNPYNPKPEQLSTYAEDLGLDVYQFGNCLKDGKYRDWIAKDKSSGQALGIQGTPYFTINDEIVRGAYPYEHFKSIIDGILDPSKKKTQPTAKAEDREPVKKVEFTDLDGRPSQGPEGAPVTIVEFSDFHCPFCTRVVPTVKKLREEYGNKLRVVWRHYPLPFHQGADRTHQASECAFRQGKFWDYHDRLFEKTGQFKNDDALVGLARELGLNEGQFKACLDLSEIADIVKNDVLKGAEVGVSGTPALFVNGVLITGALPYEYFKSAVDHALDPSQPFDYPEAKVQPKAPEAPKQVTMDDLSGKPSQGSLDAPVTIVEFSDFHCPFCQRAVSQMEQIMNNFPGKVRRVWRHYPLPFHVDSPKAHEASECANDQGQFWEYKSALFEALGETKTSEQLNQIAANLQLDGNAFSTCLESGVKKPVIEADIEKAKEFNVNGTPTFFINGERMVGAQPYEAFEAAVKRKLEGK